MCACVEQSIQSDFKLSFQLRIFRSTFPIDTISDTCVCGPQSVHATCKPPRLNFTSPSQLQGVEGSHVIVKVRILGESTLDLRQFDWDSKIPRPGALGFYRESDCNLMNLSQEAPAGGLEW